MKWQQILVDSSESYTEEVYAERKLLMQYFMCRLLYSKHVNYTFNNAEEVLSLCGIEIEGTTITKVTFYELLRQRISQIEAECGEYPDAEINTGCNDFLNAFKEVFSLSISQEKIVLYALLIDLEDWSKTILSSLHVQNNEQFYRAISYVLSIPVIEVANILNVDSFLRAADMIHCAVEPEVDLSYYPVVSGNVTHFISLWNLKAVDKSHIRQHLVHEYCKPVNKSSMPLENLKGMVDTPVVIDYLTAALHEKKTGQNILIYGPTGVGKTEFVHALAQYLGADLYRVAEQEISHVFIEDEHKEWRLFAAKTAQNILKEQPNTLLLMDDMDDNLLGIAGSAHNKSFINQQLESNAIPIIWVSNTISDYDPAVLRRFDLKIEFKHLTATL